MYLCIIPLVTSLLLNLLVDLRSFSLYCFTLHFTASDNELQICSNKARPQPESRAESSTLSLWQILIKLENHIRVKTKCVSRLEEYLAHIFRICVKNWGKVRSEILVKLRLPELYSILIFSWTKFDLRQADARWSMASIIRWGEEGDWPLVPVTPANVLGTNNQPASFSNFESNFLTEITTFKEGSRV